MLLFEHKTRSDGCVEEVSIGFQLAQRGLAKCSDYENVKNEESADNNDEESCESERKVLESKESELSLTSAVSETSGKSNSSDLLEKMFAPQEEPTPATHTKQKLLTPLALSTKSGDHSSKICDSEGADTELSNSNLKNENGSSSQTTTTGNESRDQSRDQEQSSPHPVASDHVTEVTSAVTDSNISEVNPDSVESSV